MLLLVSSVGDWREDCSSELLSFVRVDVEYSLLVVVLVMESWYVLDEILELAV